MLKFADKMSHRVKIDFAIFQINKLLQDYDLNTTLQQHLDPNKLMALLHQYSTQCGTPDQLAIENKDNDPSVNELIKEYKSLIQKGVDRYNEIVQHNQAKVLNKNSTVLDKVKKIKNTALGYIKEDNAIELKNALESFGGPSILDVYSYALRVAACGNKTNCLKFLIKSQCANILEPGQDSKKIALHLAIEKCHIEAIKLLLWATQSDLYAPCRQLLIGKDGSRPIDLLMNHPIHKERMLMLEVVLEIINDPKISDLNMSNFDLIRNELENCKAKSIIESLKRRTMEL